MESEKKKVKTGRSVYSLIVSQLWNDVALKFRKNVLKQEPNVPWMRYREIDMIRDLLINLQPSSCLEWGAGDGTLYFTQFIPENARWISIEHDKDWADLVKKRITTPKVSIVHKSPNHEPEPGIYTCGTYDQHNDGTYEDFLDYIEYPEQHKPFDFILVDGRARKQCIIKSKELLSEDGIVLLHDANRSYYHEAFENFEKSVTFFDQRDTYGGLWMGTNSKKALNEFIDIETYSKLWSAYRRLGNIIKV